MAKPKESKEEEDLEEEVNTSRQFFESPPNHLENPDHWSFVDVIKKSQHPSPPLTRARKLSRKRKIKRGKAQRSLRKSINPRLRPS